MGTQNGPGERTQPERSGDRYTTGRGTGHAAAPDCDTPNTVLLITLEAGHYYHVRISPLAEEQGLDLEVVNSLIPRATPLSARPTELSPDERHPLMTIVAKQISTWHQGHILYCL